MSAREAWIARLRRRYWYALALQVVSLFSGITLITLDESIAGAVCLAVFGIITPTTLRRMNRLLDAQDGVRL